jgi:hypothetical protein
MPIAIPQRPTPAGRILRAMTRIIAASVAALGLALLAPAAHADAQSITQTTRVEMRTHYVARPSVTTARYVRVQEGASMNRMVHWRMDDGSRWISPSKACVGPRHWACEVAWRRAARLSFVVHQGD